MIDPAYEIGLDDFQALELGLREACKEMSENSRGAAITALQAVIQFVESVPRLEDQNLLHPLTQLMAALHDVENGRVSPMLQPGATKGKPEDASFRKVQKAYVIMAIDALIKAGMKVEAACNFLVPLIEKAGVPIHGGRGTPEWKTIKNWRSDLSKQPRSDQIRRAIDALRREFDLSDYKLAELKAALRERLPAVLRHCQAGLE